MSLKKMTAAALAMVMALSLAACGGTTDQAADANADSGEKKTYKIGTDTTFAPFEFQDESGKYVGIDIDLMNAIAENQGFAVEFQSLGFNAAVQALEAGQVDGVIAGMSITDDRQKQFDFSDPYFDSGVVMGVKDDNADIESYEDLKGKKVAVKIGTEGQTFAESIKDEYGFTTVTFDDSNSMYLDVRSGNSVACFEDYPVMGYAISQGVGLKMVTEKEQGSSYGFAVNKDQNAELLEMFNTGLANIKEDGTYDEIMATYIKDDTAADDTADVADDAATDDAAKDDAATDDAAKDAE